MRDEANESIEVEDDVEKVEFEWEWNRGLDRTMHDEVNEDLEVDNDVDG
jgi:hypothetical protein